MSIEDYMNTDFRLTTITKTKVDGRLKDVFTLDPITYKCAIFTPATTRLVRVGKEDYVIQKTMYCEVTIPIEHGDYITVDDEDFDIGNIMNTNHNDSHYQISLIKRIS